MTQKRAVITGITGQDGAYLSSLLLKNNYKVFGIVRDLQNAHLVNLKSLSILESITLEEIDLQHGFDFLTFIRNNQIDEVYHLAAQSSVGLSFKEPYATIKDNFNLTVNLIEQIRLVSHKIKFYNSVSSEIFGNQNCLPITENSLLQPVSPYGLSKSFSYQIGKLYRDLYGVFICNGILFNHESDLRRGNFFINKVINECYDISIKKSLGFTLGNLDIKRDFGYAPKYVEAMFLMMQQNIPSDYIVCSSKPILLRDVVDFILQKFYLSWDYITIDKNLIRDDEIWEIYGDNSKIKSIGWTYDLNFFDVLNKIIDEKIKIKHK